MHIKSSQCSAPVEKAAIIKAWMDLNGLKGLDMTPAECQCYVTVFALIKFHDYYFWDMEI